jgi:hypothetical protein
METKSVNSPFSLTIGGLIVICAAFTIPAQVQPGVTQSSTSAYECVQRGPHSKVWQQSVVRTNQSGIVTTNLHSYTELATGLCYLQNGRYIDSVEQISPAADGAEAVQGRHQVHWAANANTPGGAVHVQTPDGRELRSTVYGLAYYDTGSGSNVMLALLQDSTATIVGSNTLVYGNAFSNLTADIRYTYSKAGLSQDIVLKQNPPPPAEYGLNPATTRLQVITEFFNPPSPVKTAVTTNGVSDDRILGFGEMSMGVGHAFLFPSNAKANGGGPVAKHWTTIDNRTFLMEEIRYSSISNLLTTLHSSMIKPDTSRVKRTVSLDPPKAAKISAVKKAQPVGQTKVMSKDPALVMDYELLGTSGDNYIFQGDTTYLITGACNLAGTTILEGGTVIKYANNSTAGIEVDNVVCETAPYRPAVFTSMNDDSVGVAISGSTGDPSTDYAGGIALCSSNLKLQNVRFNHLAVAFSFPLFQNDQGELDLTDFQILNCTYAFNGSHASYNLNNGLIYNIQFEVMGTFELPEDGGYQTLNGVNLTIHNCGDFETIPTTMATFLNCLIVQVTNLESELGSIAPVFLPNPATNDTVILDTDPGVFQTVGAGAHYLAANSPYQGVGTTEIDPGLLADLETKTVFPPFTYSNVTITSDLTLGQYAQRDNNGSTLAVGYHYDPIDYAFGNVVIFNANMAVAPGTAIASFYAISGENQAGGLMPVDGANINFTGTATYPIYFVQYNVSQEQSSPSWQVPNCLSGAWGSFSMPLFWTTPSSASFRFTMWPAISGTSQIFADNLTTPSSGP